jgi:ZIP family zinc transporter
LFDYNLINMLDFLTDFNPIIQTLFGTGFTYAMTALGAGMVFFTKNLNRRMLDGMLGFAAGVMIAASFWSLLAPAIEMSQGKELPMWIPPLLGFLAGGFFLRLVDRIIPHLHFGLPMEEAEGISTSWRRTTLLVLAITLHNIPEGLAVGVAFGAVSAGFPEASLAGAIALAIGIGIQNFPEGAAVSVPLRREGLSRAKSWWFGQISGIVEPMAGILGAWVVIFAQEILPYALSFAAGAMIFVVAEEVIPEAQAEGNHHIATAGVMLGFAVMMTLDVGLG